MKKKTLSIEERKEIAQLYLTTRVGQMELVERYGVSLTTIQNIIREHRERERMSNEATRQQ